MKVSGISFNLKPRIRFMRGGAELFTKIYVCLEEELTADNPYVAFAKKIHRELKPKNCYLADGEGNTFLCVLPKDGPKGLGNQKPGLAHVSGYYGSVLSALITSSPNLDKRAPFNLKCSGKVLSAIKGNEDSFLASLSHRSVQNRIAKKEVENNPIKFVDIALSQEEFSESSLQRSLIFSEGMSLAKSLINAPSNLLTPQSYEDAVTEQIAKFENIKLDVIAADQLEEEGCGLITAVGKGSDIPPRILKLTYNPAAAKKFVAIVGKGITFDTGGLDIKPSSPMRNMKKDMGGSAAALGAFMSCVRLNLPIKVTCFLAIAENMISGRAMRPGDVYKAKNGISVEIDNTDAEGRLVLADALCYAAEEKPDWIIDLATLTGAARVATGPNVDALFSNTADLEKLLFETGNEIGDWVWPMPLVDDYEGMMDSSVADMVNSSSTPHGGAITAALFLRRFVGKIPWSHIDTYMWTDKQNELNCESGGTGKCVRLVSRAIEKFSQI